MRTCSVLSVSLALVFSMAFPARGLDLRNRATLPGGTADLEPRPTVPHRPGAPGDVVTTFDAPDARPAGLGWDGTFLWLVGDASHTIYQIDPADGSVVDFFPVPEGDFEFTFGLDHDGTTLWGDADGAGVDEIYQADGSGVELLRYASPLAEPNGVLHDGTTLWHSGFLEDLQELDPADGTVLRTLPAPGNGFLRDLAWDGTSLWVVDANGTPDDAIYEVDPADGTVLSSFVPAGVSLELMFGLAFDGRYLWLSDLSTAEIHQIDLGLDPPAVTLACETSRLIECPGGSVVYVLSGDNNGAADADVTVDLVTPGPRPEILSTTVPPGPYELIRVFDFPPTLPPIDLCPLTLSVEATIDDGGGESATAVCEFEVVRPN